MDQTTIDDVLTSGWLALSHPYAFPTKPPPLSLLSCDSITTRFPVNPRHCSSRVCYDRVHARFVGFRIHVKLVVDLATSCFHRTRTSSGTSCSSRFPILYQNACAGAVGVSRATDHNCNVLQLLCISISKRSNRASSVEYNLVLISGTLQISEKLLHVGNSESCSACSCSVSIGKRSNAALPVDNNLALILRCAVFFLKLHVRNSESCNLQLFCISISRKSTGSSPVENNLVLSILVRADF